MDELSGEAADLTWPEPVCAIGPDGPMVRLSGLPDARKKIAWGEILSTNPALARLLREPALQLVVKGFDAEIFIDAPHAPSLPPESLKARRR